MELMYLMYKMYDVQTNWQKMKRKNYEKKKNIYISVRKWDNVKWKENVWNENYNLKNCGKNKHML